MIRKKMYTISLAKGADYFETVEWPDLINETVGLK